MAIKLKNPQAFNKGLLALLARYEKALVYELGVMVAQLENHAKLSGAYKDRTSNLRSSIGGVVLKNGKPMHYEGFAGAPKGTKTGRSFLDTLVGQFAGTNYAIVVVAGMEYASYVENNGLNVLKKSELKMRRELPIVLQNLINKLK